ncbi:hypothetical protein RQP46_002792 [Phenoliferia psychrophenolica]
MSSSSSTPFPSFTDLALSDDSVRSESPPPPGFYDNYSPHPRGAVMYSYPAYPRHYQHSYEYGPPPPVPHFPHGHPAYGMHHSHPSFMPMGMPQSPYDEGFRRQRKLNSKPPKGPYALPSTHRIRIQKSKHSSCEPCRLKRCVRFPDYVFSAAELDEDNLTTPTTDNLNRLFDGDYGSWDSGSINMKSMWPESSFSSENGAGEFASWGEST